MIQQRRLHTESKQPRQQQRKNCVEGEENPMCHFLASLSSSLFVSPAASAAATLRRRSPLVLTIALVLSLLFTVAAVNTVLVDAQPDPTCIVNCAPGYYNTSAYNNTCTICPINYVCAGGTAAPAPCPAGSTKAAGPGTCTACPRRCSSGPGMACAATGAGFYVTSNPGQCIPCADGRFNSAINAAIGTCTLAPARRYVNTAKTGVLTCRTGYICPSKTIDMEIMCPTGTYSSATLDVCVTCPAGEACPAPTDTVTVGVCLRHSCTPGTFTTGGQTNCQICPAGSRCPDTTGTVIACPVGTYSLGSAATCTACPAATGFACPGQSSLLACPAGQYSNFTNCIPCPGGFQCTSPPGVATACALGRYSLPGASLCTVCPPGWACPTTDSAPVQCMAGTFAVGGSSMCQQCNATTTPTGIALYSGIGASTCDVCPAGSACPNAYSAPIPCPRGFTAQGGNFSCFSCAQLFPNLGAYTVSTGSATCSLCPGGSYCPFPDQLPKPCPPSTFSTGGTRNCTRCPHGFECPTPVSLPSPCPAGTYSLGYATCRICPENNYCPSPASGPLPCAADYVAAAGSTACTLCPPGAACNVSSSSVSISPCSPGEWRKGVPGVCTICPAGYYCATVDTQPRLCSRGTYSHAGSTYCSLCPAGFFCANYSSGPVPCWPGTYSLLGSHTDCTPAPPGFAARNPWSYPVRCEDGTYTTGAGNATNCTRCPPGWACPDTTTFATAYRCPDGTYTPATGGVRQCTMCRAGHMCPTIYEYLEIQCPPGTYSYAQSTNCTSAPPGYYAPRIDATPGSPMPLPCVPGTFSHVGGATACSVCPAGFACPSTTLDILITCANGTWTTQGMPACVPAERGFYSPRTAVDLAQPLVGPVGVGRQVPCAPGSYSASPGAFECTKCPSGFICTSSTQFLNETCPQGFFTALGQKYVEIGATNCAACPAGGDCSSSTAAPTACAPGTFATAAGCVGCRAGSYCATTSSPPTICPAGQWSAANAVACSPCSNGYFCTTGSTNSTPTPCPLGSFCPAGIMSPVPCPAGSYGATTGAATVAAGCAVCVAGKYCPLGSIAASISCPAGHYCPIGSGFPSPCPAGTYSKAVDAITRATCKICPAGYFCPSATVDPIIVPAGYYAPAGTAGPYDNACPAGTFSSDSGLTTVMMCQQCFAGHSCPSSGLSAPIPCNIGTYQSDPGQIKCVSCEAGWACPRAGLTTSLSSTCAAGHFCPRGTGSALSNPCPAGTFSFRKNLQEAGECEICWRGFACPSGTGWNPLTPVPCAAGHFCPGVPKTGRDKGLYYYLAEHFGSSAASPTQFPCPPGTMSSATDLWAPEQCTDCTPGEYCTGGGAAPSGLCAAGHFCPRGSYFAQQVPCPPGTWQPTTGAATSSGACLACAPGHFCPAGSITMIGCPRGTYSPFNRTIGPGPAIGFADQQCVLSPAGYESASIGTIAPTVCRAGKYSRPGGLCTPCEAGRFCPHNATTYDQMTLQYLCPAGLLCPASMNRLPSPVYDLTPAGFYTPTAATGALPCPPGTINPSQGATSLTDCLLAPAGYFGANSGRSNVTGECAPGYYCPPGSTTSTQEPCPAGTFRDSPRAESEDFCQACPARSYCPAGTATPLACPRGYYCPCGTAYPLGCPIGTYGNSTSLMLAEECSPCPPGYYCDGVGMSHPTGLCDAGFYCVLRAFTSAPTALPTGGLCPKGGYCPAGSSAPLSCAPGEFNNVTGASTPVECQPCTPGQFCAGSNLPFPSGPCAAGYYCTGGAAAPTQFRTPAGSFSLPGAPSPTPCPLGTYQPVPAQGSCLTCIKGNYCPSTGLVNFYPCPLGSYCPPASVTPRSCPLGTYQPEYSRTNITQCVRCSAGAYCQFPNISKPTGFCSPGFYCRHSCINAECSLYLNPAFLVATNLPTPSEIGLENSIGGECPYGRFCPNATSIPPRCPPGTVRDAVQGTSNESCAPCPPSFYCDRSGMSTKLSAPLLPLPCQAGYYCPGALPGSSFGCTDSQCSLFFGEPCDLNQRGCWGTTNVDLAAASPAPRMCPTGFFCPAQSAVPTRCMTGNDLKAQWQPNRGRTSCDVCPAGFYCDYNDVKTLQVAARCPVGHYCPQGTGAPQPMCPEGSWSNNTQLVNRTECNRCPAGVYCPDKGISVLSGITTPMCWGGYYCTSGALDGFGRWGVLGGNGGICPMGYYCPNGTKTNTSFPCPSGSYKPTLGGSSLTSCLPCSPGKYCTGPAQGAVTGVCSPGYYCPRSCQDTICSNFASLPGVLPGGACIAGHFCPADTPMPFPCARGWYQPNIMQSECLGCPAGYYCGAATATPAICPVGHYCPNGTMDIFIPKCPVGSYNPVTGATNITACLPCAPGAYCETAGLNGTALPLCAAGYFCTNGSKNMYGTPGDALGGFGGICTSGSYCPAGTSVPINCAPGTYQPNLGMNNASSCLPCLGGFACVTYGLSDSRLTPCAPGYFCPGSCSTPQCGNICPVGRYCAQNTAVLPVIGAINPQPCSPGTFSIAPGAWQCTSCPAGTHAAATGMSQCVACPAGTYSSFNSTAQCTLCPPGTFNGVENQTSCQLCTAGNTCSAAGLTTPNGVCNAGYWCTAGAIAVLADSSSMNFTSAFGLVGAAGIAPVGHYALAGTTTAVQWPCPISTYNPMVGATNITACRACEPGMYCDAVGLSATSGKCADGYFCPRGCSDATCANMPCTNNCADYINSPYLNGGVCPAGFYCRGTASRGAVLPEACPPGTSAPKQGMRECTSCPAGRWCGTAAINGTACLLGRYCPENTTLDIPNCPEGSFNDMRGSATLAECVLCPQGRYCARKGNHSWTSDCVAGFWCGGGAKNAFGESGPLGGAGGICAKGHYCGPASVQAKQVACPNTTFQPVLGASNQSYCLTCSVGFYCSNMGQENVSAPCDAGYFCRNGCRDARCSNVCPLGNNCSLTGEGGACPLGYYCARETNNTPTATMMWPNALTTIRGAIDPVPCPQGWYTPSWAQTNCTLCPAGFFCHAGNINPIPQPCPAGHYCPAGSSPASPVRCPIGTFSNAVGLVDMSQCSLCTAGASCTTSGLTAPNGGCAPGYFCPGAAFNAFGEVTTATPSAAIIVSSTPFARDASLQYICPAGFYCVANSPSPAACPAGYFGTAVGGQSLAGACSYCTGGFYCDKQNATAVTGPCFEGYACPAGCRDPQCMVHVSTDPDVVRLAGQCPIGFYCPTQTVVPLGCPPGWLQDLPGQPACKECIAGTYCGANATVQIPCLLGHYCPEKTNDSYIPKCPPGTFGNITYAERVEDCSRCLSGVACIGQALTAPNDICAPGYWCTSGADTTLGTVGAVLNGSAGGCPSGHFCPAGTRYELEFPCPPSTFNPENFSTNATACRSCPVGYYCEGSGKSAVTGVCDGGFWCRGNSQAPNASSELCQRGFYCPRGTVNQLGCPPGTYNPDTGSESIDACIACPAGSYCAANSSAITGPCAAGYYCVENSTVPNPATGGCPIGSFCPTGSAAPILCTPGNFCGSERLANISGRCDGGYFCTRNATVSNPTDNVTGDICWAGHFCPSGSDSPLACDPGTYNPSIGQATSFACLPCTGGKFCPTSGLVSLGPVFDCPPGYYCPPGSVSGTTNECPLGFWCPTGVSSPMPCPSGNFSDAPRLSSCKPCAAGTYCNALSHLCNNTNYTTPHICPAGFYCPPMTQYATAYPCPVGTFSNITGLKSSSECTPCPPKYYCPIPGMTELASPGRECDAGFFCTGGSSVANPTDGVVGNMCPQGFFCPAGSSAPTPCPVGTFGNSTQGVSQAAVCVPCTAGSYCGVAGSISITGPCQVGFYCDGGQSSPTQKICPFGHSCPAGAVAPVACASGTYSANSGSGSCQTCSAGKYCDAAQPCQNVNMSFGALWSNYTCQRTCPPGYYCPAGTVLSTQYPCPFGTVGVNPGAASVALCPPCLAGYYCDSPALSPDQMWNRPCGAGYWCKGNASTPFPTDGVTGQLCPAGHFCPMGNISNVPIKCPAGTFNPAVGAHNDSACEPCLATKACTIPGLSAPNADCSAGFYCPGGESVSNPPLRICPKGFRCPALSAQPIACAGGMTTTTVGQSVCTACPISFYCEFSSINGTHPVLCPPGHWCGLSTATRTQNPCAPGTYTDALGTTAPGNCLPCRIGRACPWFGHFSPLPDCAAGHYCTGGAATTTPTLGAGGYICPAGRYCNSGTLAPQGCPPGTFGNGTGLSNITECSTCSPGKYCGSSNLTQPDGICNPGFYCTAGASSGTPSDGVTGNVCPGYKVCPAGSAAPQDCPNGRFARSNDTGLSVCRPCPEGFFCNLAMQQSAPYLLHGSYVEPVTCPIGKYCPLGTGVPVDCPEGTFNNVTGLMSDSQCQLCLPGWYCYPAGRVQPTGLCFAGYYCSLGSPTPTPDQPTNALTVGSGCAPGHYCPTGSHSGGLSCDAGYMYAGRYAKNVSVCSKCTPGYYCASQGMSNETGLCNAGFYCPGGQSAPSEAAYKCPRGSYCVAGSPAPTNCPGGQFQSTEAKDNCTICPAGYYCPAGGTITPINCTTPYICPEGSAAPMLCPAGTYNEGNAVLTRLDQCIPCPGGYFCNNGTISGNCSAGYLCEYGNYVPNPSGIDTPQTKGGLCPLGHWCPEAATQKYPCANSTVGYNTGLQRPTDCQVCRPGSFCLSSSVRPIPCPKGYYCPGYGLTAKPVIECPPGTFGPDENATDLSWCQPCAAGRYCPRPAMTSPSFITPPGFYSAMGQVTAYPCPAGTYNNGTLVGAVGTEVCLKCPAGKYCAAENAGAAFVQNCPEGTFCPEGSAAPFHCPGGSFCALGAPEPTQCEAGFYCPAGASSQTQCWNGTYCPAGSESPLLCPSGMVSTNSTPLRDSLFSSCKFCAPGTWSSNSLWCEPCAAGHVCSGPGTNVEFPVDAAVEKGYICPLGHYCPSGSNAPTPCPPGRFNNRTGGRTINACLKCPSGFYNPDFSSTTCKRCGISATSPEGSAGCSCIGRYRSFQPDDGSCRCIPGYIFYADGNQLSEADSSFSCQPIVYDRCQPGFFRSSAGVCVEGNPQDLCNACPGQVGIVDTQIGVCSCSQLQSEDEVCDQKCRNEVNTITIDSLNGIITLRNRTTGRAISFALDGAAVLGKKRCGLDRQECTVRLLSFGPQGIKGVYNPTEELFNKTDAAVALTLASSSSSFSSSNAAAFALGSSERRMAATLSNQGKPVTGTDARTLTNPIVCLNLGETMMFDVSHFDAAANKSHYPVYVKDSLLNTNPNFDYTAFRELGEKLRDQKLLLTMFLYSFSDPGVYVFSDSINTTMITIIRVVTINEKCPSAVFMAVTEGSLVGHGVSRTPDILLAPDWLLIGVLLGGLFSLVLAIIVGLWYFRNQSWDHLGSTDPRYRNRGLDLLNGKAAALASKGTHLRKTQLLANGEERLVTPPGSSSAITLRLDTDYKTFDTEQFLKVVAADMDVDPEYVLVLSVTEGSTIVRLVVTGTPNAQSIADGFFDRLSDPNSAVHSQLPPVLAFDQALPAGTSPSGAAAARGAAGQLSSTNSAGFNVSLLEDEFWDYERQIDLEGFNVRTLYDKLEDQTVHVVAQLANQRDDLLLLCDKILVESEALKEMFLKIKLDIDDRTRGQKSADGTRLQAIKDGKLPTDLPEGLDFGDLKGKVAGFLDSFFNNWLRALASGAFNGDPSNMVPPPFGVDLDVPVNSGANKDFIDLSARQTHVQPPTLVPLEMHDDNIAPLSIAPLATGKRDQWRVSKYASKTSIALSEFPSQLRDDEDDAEAERLRRGGLREKDLALKLARLRRKLDEASMPLGLSNDQIVPGVTTEEEANRIKAERRAWFAERRAERVKCDEIPNYLRDDETLAFKDRIKRSERRQVQLYKRLERIRQALGDLADLPENMVDADGLSAAERESRRQRRDKHIAHRVQAARSARADVTVPLDLLDDSDLEPAERKDRHDAHEDRAGTLRARNPDAPDLPDASAPGLTADQRRARDKLNDSVLVTRSAVARAALAEQQLPEGMSDHSDLDEAERAARRTKRAAWLASHGGSRGGGPSSPSGSDAGAAAAAAASSGSKKNASMSAVDDKNRKDGGSESLIHSALLALKHGKMVDGLPVEYLDDNTLEEEDRKHREELRARFAQGRGSKPDDFPPENENERGISDAERRKRQERNQAFRRGQIATYGIDAASLREKLAEIRQKNAALANQQGMQEIVDLGKEQQKLLELPEELTRNDDPAARDLKRKAFLTGRRAATVSALPSELDASVAGLSASDAQERKTLTARFNAAKASAEKVGVPKELQGDAELEAMFRSGRNGQRGKAVEELADVETGERKQAIVAAYDAGRQAAKVGVIPDEFVGDPDLRKAFHAGLSGASEVPEALGGKDATDAVKAAFRRGKDAHAAIEASIPAELRDDVPMLSAEEIAERRKLQAIFKTGLRAALAEQALHEAIDATPDAARKDKLKKAFMSGVKGQKQADAVPQELSSAALQATDMSDEDKARAAKERAAFIRGRAAQHMADVMIEDLEPTELFATGPGAAVPVSAQAGSNRKTMHDVLEVGRRAQRKFDDISPEMRDAASLSAEERTRRAKLREALHAGRNTKAMNSTFEELVEAVEMPASMAPSADGKKPAGAANQKPANQQRGADGPKAELSEEMSSELKQQIHKLRKEQNTDYKRLKQKHQVEMSSMLEELEEEGVASSKKLEFELGEENVLELRRLADKQALELLSCPEAKRAEMQQRHAQELVELKALQEKRAVQSQQALTERTEEKKTKVKDVLSRKQLMEARLLKGVAQEQEKEIKELYEQAKAQGDAQSEALQRDMKHQQQVLFEQLKMRDQRMKAKAQHEKQFLEQQLKATAAIEKEMLEKEIKAREEEQLKRIQDNKAKGFVSANDAAAEETRVRDRAAKQAELERKALKSHQADTRLELENELQERQNVDREAANSRAAQEVDELLKQAEKEKEAAAAQAREEEEKAKKSKMAASALAMQALVKQQQAQQAALRQKLEEDEKTAATAAVKEDAEAKIKKMEAEYGKKLTPEQRKAIFDECQANLLDLNRQLSAEQQRQQDDTKRRIEEKRRAQERKLARQQADELKKELDRQEKQTTSDASTVAASGVKIVKIDQDAEATARAKAEQEELEARQARAQEELRKKHLAELKAADKEVEAQLLKEQQDEIERLKQEAIKQKHEMRQKQLQQQATSQMTAEQKSALQQEHEEEARKLEAQLSGEEALQKERYQAQLRARKAKRRGELTDSQQSEAADAERRQKEERDAIITTKQKENEQKVIDATVAKNGSKAKDNAEGIAQVVKAERHREEFTELKQRQAKRRETQMEIWKQRQELEKEERIGNLQTAMLNEIAANPGKKAQIEAGRDARINAELAKLAEKHKNDLPAKMDELEMELVQEQLALKSRQIADIAQAAHLDVPASVLQQLQNPNQRINAAAVVAAGGPSEEEIRKQKEKAEAELLAFKEEQEAKQKAMRERIAKDKLEYEAKMREDFERRQREQEEEMARREEQMRINLEADIANRESKLRDRLDLTGKPAAGAAAAAASKIDDAELRNKLLAEGKDEEARLRAAVDEEMARQRSEHEAMLKARKERAAKRANAARMMPTAESVVVAEGAITADVAGTFGRSSAAASSSGESKSAAADAAAAAAASTASVAPTVEAMSQVISTITTASSATTTSAAGGNMMMMMVPAASGSSMGPQNPQAVGQWAQSVVAQLQASPLYEKVVNIEKLLLKQQRSGLLSYYLDAKDRDRPSNEGTLTEMSVDKLPTDRFVVWFFGNALCNRIASTGVSIPKIRIALASSLPSTQGSMTAFRHSYYFDAGKKTLYVRDTRLTTLGEFSVVLIHALAHIKASQSDNASIASWSDTDPRFLQDFYGLLEICAEETFFARNDDVVKRETPDDRPYRPMSIMSAQSLKKIEEKIQNIPVAERTKALKNLLKL